MSTDFDFNSQPSAAAAPGAPGAGTATLPPPAAPAPRAATKPAAEIDSEPLSGLTTLAITAAPPIAMIAASYLAHLYGQWMMIGLAIAAVIGTALGVKAVWRRARDRRANKGSRAARTARTNPSARAAGRILGNRGTGATGGKSGGGLFGRGGKGAAGRKTAAQAAGGGVSPSAAARSAKRNARTTAATKSGAGTGAVGRHFTSGRGTGPGSKSAGRSGNLGPGGSKSSTTRNSGAAKPTRSTTRPGASGGSTSRNTGAHAKPSLTKRALGKFTGRGSGSAGGSASTTSAAKKAAAKKKAALKKKSTAPKPTVKKTSRKAAAAARAAKKAGKKPAATPKKKPTTPAKKTPKSSKKKGAAKSPTKTKRRGIFKKRKPTTASKRKGGPAAKASKKKPYTKGAKKMHRRLKRAATSRKVRMMKRGSKKLWHGTRRAMRAGNAFVSPLLAKGVMAFGKRLGWAHRNMLRIANSSSGPNFMPRIARGMAWGLAKALRSGQWVMRRRKVSAWLLRHYAATGLASPAGVAASVARKVSLKKAVKVKPGAPVPIHVPSSPTTTGARTVGATPIEAVSEAFDFVTGQYEPESVESLTQHLDDFAPMFENFAESLMRMAERLQDQYGVKPGVVDMLLEFGSACAGMTDMVQSVIEAWRIEQAEDIERHENPRPGEAEFWNVQP
ncbi:hypothetical protein [Streptomyces sp. bgisy060]|uniref:hypothetical protein n=1 Tax=Streptomyces sp. bgisy060 TaxID=3413775 RepID=UPI003EC0DF88